VTGWGHGELMAMTLPELAMWSREAVAYWQEINEAP
jgi:hypothetical protein